MSTLFFNARTRNAGDLSAAVEQQNSDSVLNRTGSIRSNSARFRSNSISKNADEAADLFVEPVKEATAPPSESMDDKHHRKSKSHHHHHRKESASENGEKKHRKEKRGQVENNNTEDDYLELLKKLGGKKDRKNRDDVNGQLENNSALPPKYKASSINNNHNNGNDDDVKRRESNKRATTHSSGHRNDENSEQKVTTSNAAEDEMFSQSKSVVGVVNTTSEVKQAAVPKRRSNSIVKTNAFMEPDPRDKQTRTRNHSVDRRRGRDDDDDSGSDNDVRVDIDGNSGRPKTSKQIGKGTRVLDLAHDLYFKPIFDGESLRFMLTPAPHDKTIQCKIVCERGLFTDFQFYMENLGEEGSNLLIMRATRRLSSAKPSFSLSAVNHVDSSMRGDPHCARLQSENMSKRRFHLKLNNSYLGHLNNEEILDVQFTSFPNEPTEVSANLSVCNPTNGMDPSRTTTHLLKNLKPQYDLARKKFVLQYNGRAKRSSKHNFQLIDEVHDPNQNVIQLGKVDTFLFNCDYTYPLCALQAFAIGISSLCR